MKKSVLLFLGAASLFAADYAAEGKLWWSHIQVLADDKLEGRNVGTEGFTKAVEYVSGEFKRIGLKPAGASGYLQPVKFESRTVIEGESSVAIVRDGKAEPLALGQDATLSARADLAPSTEAEMVFVGRGYVIPEAQLDDLAGVDLKGKIAVVSNGGVVPGVPGPLMSHYGTAAQRWNTLRNAGAIGMVTLSGVGAARGGAPAAGATGGAADQPAADGRGAGRGGRGAGGGGRGGRAPQPSIVLADAALQDTQGQRVAMTVTATGAEKLLADSGHTLEELQKLARANEPLPKFPLKGTLQVKAAMKREALDSTNVAGMIEGSDSKLKHEYVIMSAHLDHLGRGRAVNGDEIYNGAMDDASGIASIIEIARLFKTSGAKPKRSVIFLAVTGEEKGELGSRYFAARPTVAASSIVADINLDMFLPLYPLKVIEVQGLAESSLGETVKAAAEELGVKVQPDQEPEQNRFIRSDQYSFILNGIPALAFKFGYEPGSEDEKTRRAWVRDIYHKPSDDLNQHVDADAAAKFDRVIYGLLDRVANDKARPQWKSESFFKRYAKTGM